MAEPSVNRVVLMGRLTVDPDMRTTQSGTPVCQLRMATNERFKNSNGDWDDRPQYHTVVLWDRNAEIAEKYLSKGGRVYVEGSLQTRSWTDRDGNKRWSTEVKGRRFIMLGSPGGPSRSDDSSRVERADYPARPRRRGSGYGRPQQAERTGRKDPFAEAEATPPRPAQPAPPQPVQQAPARPAQPAPPQPVQQAPAKAVESEEIEDDLPF